MATDEKHSGSCLCGAVHITVTASLNPPDACHCGMCRKISGHYWASTDVPRDQLRVTGEDRIRWYQSSEKVRRGFCSNCGSSLFWDVPGRSSIAIAMGLFESPTHTSLGSHIFVGDKGDYYEIADGLPKSGRTPDETIV